MHKIGYIRCMRTVYKCFFGLMFLLILSGCWLNGPSPRKAYRKYIPRVFSTIGEAQWKGRGDLLFIVFNDGDTSLYNSSVRTLLKFRKTRTDAHAYKVLCENYSVVKIYRSELDSIVSDSGRYNHWADVKTVYENNKPAEAFMFISFTKRFWMHSICPLSEPAEKLHEIILVGFGP